MAPGDSMELKEEPSINLVSSTNEMQFSFEEMNLQIIEYLQNNGIDTSKITDTENVLYDPLELILENAMKKKIKSEDINIVELADFYISILYKLKKFDIRESGRVVYRASKLLKLKANELKLEKENVEYDFFEDLLEDDEFMGDLNSKDYEIPNRYKSDEIVLSLCKQAARQKYMELIPQLNPPVPKMNFFERPSETTTEQIIGLAHEEDILALKARLLPILSDMFDQNGSVPFTLLTDNISDAKSMVYIALLHLATDRKLWLVQDEMYDTELLIFPPVN